MEENNNRSLKNFDFLIHGSVRARSQEEVDDLIADVFNDADEKVILFKVSVGNMTSFYPKDKVII